MRAPILSLLAVSLAACSSGGYIVIREPVPVHEPAPEPEPLEPLELTIVRPVGDRLLIQTNRPAYVAIFEIVPEHGVALMHPSSYRQRTVLVSGMSWIEWPSESARYHRTSGAARTERYIYALASDEPLLLSPSFFRPGHLQRLLGSRTYYSTRPYTTMRVLSRELVPRVYDEEWAEDVYVLAPSRRNERYRVARIHCPDGRVHEVPAEAVHRAWCPGARPADGGTVTRRSAPRPDSIVVRDDDDKGWRVWERPEVVTRRRPVDRVEEPAPGRDDDDRTEAPEEREDDRKRPGNGQARGHEKEHPGQGNAYGHEKGKANGEARGHEQEREPKNATPRSAGNPSESSVTPSEPRLEAPEHGDPSSRRPLPVESQKPAESAPAAQAPAAKEEPKSEPPGKSKAQPKQSGKKSSRQTSDSTSTSRGKP